MECWATGEETPFIRKPFVPEDSAITKIIDSWVKD